MSLRAGLRFLTVLPLAYDAAESRVAPAATLVWFPVIGLAVGVPVYAALLLPIPAFPRAALALALWVGLTGGLHEDGFMDCADAAFAPVPRERRLEILKDPRAGAHGVTAGTLLLLLRFSALAVVPATAALVAPVLGRWVMALSLAWSRPARADGLGARFAAGARPFAPTLAMLVLLALLAGVSFGAGTVPGRAGVGPAPALPAVGPVRLAAALIAAAVFGGGTATLLSRRFGGLTGDGHGAAGLVAEAAALFAFVPVG
ncbi:MAG TPA: adenosylcobinamide-GDP ribazoletransferase [Longimicrobiales bacterium]